MRSCFCGPLNLWLELPALCRYTICSMQALYSVCFQEIASRRGGGGGVLLREKRKGEGN